MTPTLELFLCATGSVAGGVIAIAGARRSLAAARNLRLDPERALGILRGFRISITGVCLAGAAIGWFFEIGWLFGVSLIICAEEVLESSVGIAALRHDPLILDSPNGSGRPQ